MAVSGCCLCSCPIAESIEDEHLVDKILSHRNLWDVKRKPPPAAQPGVQNGPGVAPLHVIGKPSKFQASNKARLDLPDSSAWSFEALYERNMTMRMYAQKLKSTPQTASAKPTRSDRAHWEQGRVVGSILQLQRTFGNLAVQRMLQADAENLEAGSAGCASTRSVHDFNQLRAHTDTRTSESAQAFNPAAYTVSAIEKLSPSTAKSGTLSANELAPAIQNKGTSIQNLGLLDTIQRQQTSAREGGSERDDEQQPAPQAEVETAIRSLNSIRAVVAVGRSLLRLPWLSESNRESQQIVSLAVGRTEYSVRRESFEALYRVAEEHYAELYDEVLQRSEPTSGEARSTADDAFPRTLRDAVQAEESHPAEGVANIAGRTTLQTLVSLMLELELSSPLGLGLYSSVVGGIVLGLRLVSGLNNRYWWDELRYHTVNHLYGFCAGYAATMRGERVPNNSEGLTYGFGRGRIPSRVSEGAARGREVALARMAQFAQLGFSQSDIRSNARELNLFQVAYDAVHAEYMQQAERTTRAGAARDESRSINLFGGQGASGRIELMLSGIRSVIHYVGQNRAVPTEAFMHHPMPV